MKQNELHNYIYKRYHIRLNLKDINLKSIDNKYCILLGYECDTTKSYLIVFTDNELIDVSTIGLVKAFIIKRFYNKRGIFGDFILALIGGIVNLKLIWNN